MPTLDVFAADGFSTLEMTNAINLLPHKPNVLGQLGIFSPKSVHTTVVGVESREGKLALLMTANRGTVPQGGVNSVPVRKLRNFNVPHVPKYMGLIADEIQNIRAFGSDTELMTIADAVNEKLQFMRDEHETTHEFHRVGAMKGTVLDGDNATTLANFYTEFGTSQQTQDWAAADASFSTTATGVIRKIGTALGNSTFNRIVCLCGDTYFDGMIKHASMVTAYERWRDGEFLRVAHLGPEWYSLAASGFEYFGILFVNYRGQIGDVVFIPATEAFYFPTGVPGMFQEIMAPADFNETVNTKGRRLYAKQEPMAFDKGISLHTQSNVLFLNTRPRAVIKSTFTP